MLCAWDLAAALPDARLVVSELVTNALRHGLAAAGAAVPCAPRAHSPLVGLRLLRHPGGLRCEVTDPSDIMPARLVPDGDADFGRGLCLVAASAASGVRPPLPAGGKCLWADLCLPAMTASLPPLTSGPRPARHQPDKPPGLAAALAWSPAARRVGARLRDGRLS